MTLACKDVDSSIHCPFVARGETEDAVFTDTAKHVREVYGYTDEQFNDPEILKKIKSVIKRD